MESFMNFVAMTLMFFPLLFLVIAFIDVGIMGIIIYLLYSFAAGLSWYLPRLGWKIWQKG